MNGHEILDVYGKSEAECSFYSVRIPSLNITYFVAPREGHMKPPGPVTVTVKNQAKGTIFPDTHVPRMAAHVKDRVVCFQDSKDMYMVSKKTQEGMYPVVYADRLQQQLTLDPSLQHMGFLFVNTDTSSTAASGNVFLVLFRNIPTGVSPDESPLLALSHMVKKGYIGDKGKYVLKDMLDRDVAFDMDAATVNGVKIREMKNDTIVVEDPISRFRGDEYDPRPMMVDVTEADIVQRHHALQKQLHALENREIETIMDEFNVIRDMLGIDRIAIGDLLTLRNKLKRQTRSLSRSQWKARQ